MNKAEARIQQDIFIYHWNNYPNEQKLLFMVHNNPKNKIEGAMLKSQGLVAGVSDMIYLNPNGTAYFIEIKTPTGTQQTNQKEWQKLIESFGYTYILIRSLKDFKNHFNK